MLKPLQKSKSEGFTIIEVLIVLAIAGLIMVVVFLAVPALQRNQRNNSRKTEANNIASAVSEVQGNKGGSPIVAGDLATIVGNVKLNQYSAANISIAANTTTVPTTSTVQIIPGYTCNATDPTATPTAAASTRAVAIWYAVESGSSSLTNQCVGTGQ